MSKAEQDSLGLPEESPVNNVEEYRFEPIKGYQMLNWRGKRPFTSTGYFPAQLKEVHGPEIGGWRNKIYWGDNLQVMSHLLKEYRGQVDLVYIDPPFDSKANYKRLIELKGKRVEGDTSAFEEKQYADIWNNDEYLQFIYERLIIIRELLSGSGVIYVHLDWHVGHSVKIILDEIFGTENFVNDIVWQKIRTTKAQSKGFGNVHDYLMVYQKSSDAYFSPLYKPFNPEYIKSHYKRDENGVSSQ